MFSLLPNIVNGLADTLYVKFRYVRKPIICCCSQTLTSLLDRNAFFARWRKKWLTCENQNMTFKTLFLCVFFSFSCNIFAKDISDLKKCADELCEGNLFECMLLYRNQNVIHHWPLLRGLSDLISWFWTSHIVNLISLWHTPLVSTNSLRCSHSHWAIIWYLSVRLF